MVDTMATADVGALPLAPWNPLPLRQQMRALRSLIDGVQQLSDAGGPVTRLRMPAPGWCLRRRAIDCAMRSARVTEPLSLMSMIAIERWVPPSKRGHSCAEALPASATRTAHRDRIAGCGSL